MFNSIAAADANKIEPDTTSTESAKTWTTNANSVYIEYQGMVGKTPVIECSWDTV